MLKSISVSLNPIGPWPALWRAAAVVLFLTLWAYTRKLAAPAGAGAGWLSACGCWHFCFAC